MPTQRTETRIEVLPDGQMQIRESLIVTLDDGTELPAVHHRVVLDVDTDPDTVTFKHGPDIARIKAVQNAVVTPAVRSARLAKRAAAQASLPGA